MPERPVAVHAFVSHRMVGHQERRLVGDDTHAMREEVGAVGMRLARQFRLPRGDQIAALRAGLHLGEGCLLHCLDLAQQVLQFLVRLSQHAHAADGYSP